MAKKQTPAEFQAALHIKHPSYVLLGKYVNASTPTRFRHSCGKVINTTPKQLMSGGVSCLCTHRKRGNTGAKQPDSVFRAKLSQRQPDYKLIGAYQGIYEEHVFRHVCGKQFQGAAIRVLTGLKRCECQHVERDYKSMSPQQFHADFKRDFGARFVLRERFTNMRTPVLIQCLRCNDVQSRMPGTLRGKKATGTCRGRLVCSCEFLKTGPDKVLRDSAYWNKVFDDKSTPGEYRIKRTNADLPNGTIYPVRHVGGCDETYERRLDAHGVVCPCTLKKVPVLTETIVRDMLSGTRLELIRFNGRRNRYRHRDCGHEWDADVYSQMTRKGCPVCDGPNGAKLIRISLPDIQRRVDAACGKGEYKVLSRNTIEERGGIMTGITLKHMCGHKYETSLREIENGGTPCGECYGYGIGRTKEFIHHDITYKCQGFEPLSLAWVFDKWPDTRGVVSSRAKRPFRIEYAFMGKVRKYTVDIWIPEHNLIIEVKSPASMGLVRDVDQFFGGVSLEEVQAKAKHCLASGYKFVLHLYRHKKPIRLPIGWMDMTKQQLGQYLKIRVD